MTLPADRPRMINPQHQRLLCHAVLRPAEWLLQWPRENSFSAKDIAV
jgi:hypothetical protein